MNFSVRVVHTPAGRCPVKLKETDHDSVLEWAQLVMEHGRTNNLNYLPSALVFFAQQFYNIFTEDYKTVKNHLIDIFQISLNEELINKVNQDRINQEAEKRDNKQEVDDTKKRRGRPPKKQYSPSLENSLKNNPLNEPVKVHRPKRK
jgi:hypothetical protein